MSVVKATLIFSIATYLDVILNPLIGFITDSFYRTKLGRKLGRRRFFILGQVLAAFGFFSGASTQPQSPR